MGLGVLWSMSKVPSDDNDAEVVIITSKGGSDVQPCKTSHLQPLGPDQLGITHPTLAWW